MKKFLSFISIFLVLGTMAFADVSVKKLSDGKVEVTFFYGNPRAQEVVIAGDFTNWQAGALPMTKSDKGWTYVTTVAAGTVMKYKFISDGNWTPDLKAPDTVDDGFGGLNGLVDVDAMVAASAGTAAATADTGAAKKANLKFSTWSMVGTQAKWGDGTEDNKNELESAGLNVKSYMKVSGDALPGMPIYIEVAVAEQDGFNNLYKNGTTEWSDGFKNLLVDTIFDPLYFYGGQTAAATYLGHFKLGFNTPIVNYVTGYKYAKLPPHTNVNWTTVDKEWEAGYNSTGGFAQFDLAPLFKKVLGDSGIDVDVVLGPNRTADRAGNQYGFYGYANAKFNIGDFGQYVDFQYNGAYGSAWDTIFDEIYEGDYILGYQGIFGPAVVKLNGLYNSYGSIAVGSSSKIKYSPSSSDVTSVDEDPANKIDSVAANGNVTFSTDIVTVTAGYRLRGYQANMMYIEDNNNDDHTDISDQLGYRNTQRIFADVGVSLADKAIGFGVAPYVETVLNADEAWYNGVSSTYTSKDTKVLFAKPYFNVDLTNLAGITAKIDGYGKVKYATTEDDTYYNGTTATQFKFAEAGVKYDQTLDSDVVKELTFVYAIDNGDTNWMFNTLTADIAFAQDITAQFGCGLRTKNTGIETTPVSPFSFFVGAKKKLTVLAKPTAYVQYMYGMDPYKAFGDGPTAYNLDGYTFDDGVTDYDGYSALRCGLQWDL